MRRQISFIHCADLHIDSPFKGMSHLSDRLLHEVKESTFQALTNLVDFAIDKQVDFVLMVGDLFDSEQQSLKAQTHLRKAFQRLKEYEIDVFVSYGNHDYLNGRLFDYQFPDNVYVFDQERVTSFTYTKQGEALATIYGFSYQERAVDANKALEFKRKGDAAFHIGMLHGSISSNTDHDVYAPFQLSDLENKQFDYWALGHIHKRQVLKEQPPVIYPGNTQGRSRKETGEKGCYYVEMDQHHYSLQFEPLQVVRFETIEVDASNCQQPQELEMVLDKHIQLVKNNDGKTMLTVELKSESGQLQEWHQAGYIEELIDYLNETNESEATWVWIQKITIQQAVTWNRDELKKGQHFIGEFVRTVEEQQDVTKQIQPLFQHRRARKYMEQLTKEEQEEIKTEAENLVLHHLLKG